jgi:hypothetical protein
MRRIILSLSALAFFACGSATESPSVTADSPVVTRLSPTTATAGNTVTIIGYGFSVIPSDNIVVIGGSAIPATSYALVDPIAAGEIEQLTFTVPSGLTVGADSLYILRSEAVSNTDVQLTISP